jgi:hypothetical protein
LLAAAIDTHRITEEQFAIILSNDELGEGIINRARELNSNLDNQITVLRDQGIPINNGSVWEDLKKMDKKKAAGILTAIIAGVAVAVKGLIG